jgi:hypothetical protein
VVICVQKDKVALAVCRGFLKYRANLALPACARSSQIPPRDSATAVQAEGVLSTARHC